MQLLRNMRLPHGLCEPRERRACTACNAKEELDGLVDSYKGARIVAQDEVKAPAPKVFYYGCLKNVDKFHKEAGHYMYEPGMISVRQTEVNHPFGQYPDGTLCPQGPQWQGKALLHHKDGWTAIGFWDRTGDMRGNSNSNFIVRGTYTFDEMCKLAEEQYPELWKRFGTVTNAEKVEEKAAESGT